MNKNTKDINKEILEILGKDYQICQGSIAKNNCTKVKVLHITCNHISMLSLKDVKQDLGRCKYCYIHGKEHSIEYFQKYVYNMSKGKFECISTKMKGNHRFLELRHISCDDKCGHTFWCSLNSFNKRIPKCPYCESGTTISSLETKLIRLYGNEYAIPSEIDRNKKIYINDKIKLIHNKCGNIIYTRPNQILNCNQSGCKFCRAAAAISKLAVPKDKFIELVNNKFGNRFNIIEYTSITNKILAYDYLEEKYINIKGNSLLEKSITPHKSKGEISIEKYLYSKNINFVREKTFSDLVDILPLRYDFYIPEINVLIEYDGEQHTYKRRDDIDGKKFEKTKKHDAQKDKYANDNKIPLLRISYKNKNIEQTLNNFLNGFF